MSQRKPGDAGKGSSYRPYDREKWNAGWDGWHGKKKIKTRNKKRRN